MGKAAPSSQTSAALLLRQQGIGFT